jgi:hypothetical protein
MMKKLSLLSMLMLFAGITSIAQSIEPCGFDTKHQQKMLTDHQYENSVRTVDNRWIKYMSMASTAMLIYTPSGYVYEVPTVVHVLHTGGAVGSAYNPDSTKIAQMIDYLNKSYAAVSPFPDTTSGGCRIPLRFVLAKRTPSGAATNGIVRLNASSIPNYTAFGANASGSSGVDDQTIMAFSRWTPSDYYNVYSVNKIDGNDLYSSGGIAGFAYFPGSPTVDGMIVCASQIKSGSTTVSHEFGHAFSLRHTFEGDGGGSVCPPTTSCATTGDLVCDTEPHKRSASYPGWCPPTDFNACTGGSFKNVQNNIMDYTNCPPNRYTAGQRTRVLNVLDNERTGFKTSVGSVAPTGSIVASCVPTSSTSTAGVGPYIVSFNGNDVWTGSLSMENAAYVDHSYTQQSYVSRGVAYPITVQTRGSRQVVKVYIDYNNDGDFVDAGENVFSNTGATSGTIAHTGSFTIPTTATTCTWLRMRVVAHNFGASIADIPCGPYANNAQAEDYGVYVKDRTSADSVSIAITAGSNPSCTGSSVTFTATPKGGTPSFRWYINGVRNGVTTSTFTSSTIANNDIISCKIFYTGSCGSDSSESNFIQLKVSSTAPASAKNTLILGTNPGCSGLALVFKANVTGGGSAPTYSWRRNGLVVGGPVDTFATSTLVAGDKIWCRVVPGGTGTCSVTPVNSDTITISFAPIVPTSSIAVTAGSIPSCDSSSITFTATPLNGGPTPTFQWYLNNTAVSAATMISYTESLLKNNDTIQCRVISNHPCIVTGIGDTSWSNKIVVKRDPRFKPSLSVAITRGTNPGCLDSLLEFTATAIDGGGSPLVSWYKNGSLAAFGSVYSSTGFADKDTIVCKMNVTPASCNSVDSILWGPTVLTLSATPPAPVISLIGTLLVSSITGSIQWYGPDGLIPGATSPTFHPTKQGNYYAVVVNSGCAGSKSNVLNVSLLTIRPYNMSEMTVYPNPTTGILTLDWGTEKMNASVDVFTVTGQRVMNVLVENATSKTMDLTKLANGNYFVVIHDNKGKTGTVSVTVAH